MTKYKLTYDETRIIIMSRVYKMSKQNGEFSLNFSAVSEWVKLMP